MAVAYPTLPVAAPIAAVGQALSRIAVGVFLLSLMLLLFSALLLGHLVYQLRVRLSHQPSVMEHQ